MAGSFKPAARMSHAELRNFGLVTAAMLAALFGIALPWLFSREFPVWPWIAAALLVLPALLVPRALAPVYDGWMKVGLLLGRITTPLILSLVFVLTIVPTALIMKLIGRDPMNRRFDAELDSYRTASESAPENDLERPF